MYLFKSNYNQMGLTCRGWKHPRKGVGRDADGIRCNANRNSSHPTYHPGSADRRPQALNA